MLLELASRSGLAVLGALEPGRRARVGRGISYGPGAHQLLDVYAPPKSEAGHPVVLFLYGGGWRGEDRSVYGFIGESLAEAGFVAVLPDCRLEAEPGFPAFVADAAAAFAWTRAHAGSYGGDSGRLYAMGHSAGALSAALLAVDSRYLARHGLVSRDLAGMIGLAGGYALQSARLRALFGDAESAKATKLVRRAPPPLLLLHGEADDVVAIDESRDFAAAARRAGGAVVFRDYPGIGHPGILFALSRRFRGRAPVLDDIAAFAGIEHAAAAPRAA